VAIDVRGGLRRSRGSRGSVSSENPGKTGPKISSQIAFRYPGPRRLRPREPPGRPRAGGPRSGRPRPVDPRPAPPSIAPAGCAGPQREPGYLKAVWLEIFGPVFPGFLAEVDARNPPRSPGPAPHINFHAKSAPQTTSKAVSRHTKKSRQTAFKHPDRQPFCQRRSAAILPQVLGSLSCCLATACPLAASSVFYGGAT